MNTELLVLVKTGHSIRVAAFPAGYDIAYIYTPCMPDRDNIRHQQAGSGPPAFPSDPTPLYSRRLSRGRAHHSGAVLRRRAALVAQLRWKVQHLRLSSSEPRRRPLLGQRRRQEPRQEAEASSLKALVPRPQLRPPPRVFRLEAVPAALQHRLHPRLVGLVAQ